MADFKQRFSPSSSSPLPSFLASSPHLESSGAPNIYSMLTEQARNTSTTPALAPGLVPSTIIVDNSKFDLSSWLTNKTFLNIVAFIVLISILIIGWILICKSRTKQSCSGDNDNDNENDNVEMRSSSSSHGTRLAGAPSRLTSSGLGSNQDIAKELAKQRNEIKFLMSQLSQHDQKIQQLDSGCCAANGSGSGST
jgi:hypothetical protein